MDIIGEFYMNALYLSLCAAYFSTAFLLICALFMIMFEPEPPQEKPKSQLRSENEREE